jgi:hypothetical protein
MSAAALVATGRGAGPGAAAAAIGALVLFVVMGGAALLAHRGRARRLGRARIVARLDAIAGPPTPPAAPVRDLPS